MTRWNLSIPDETDRAVRTFLARTGGKKGDLSKFVDEAVRRHVLESTVRAAKERNQQSDQQALLDLIAEEVRECGCGDRSDG
ncbi:MAG: ribbon-helix-helix domain-containing protein [Xanthomonadales bacterium]|nr:ribbon-helix-helix domain-containing protein [Xanthomonadales bacterium]